MSSNRLLAAVWGAAGLGWVTNAVLGLDAGDATGGFYATEAVWLVVHALVLVGLVGLRRARVVAESRWGRRALDVAIAGRVVFFGAELASMAVGHDELPVFPVAVVATGIGMLITGVAVLRSGSWRGWPGLALAAMGAYPFLLIVPVFAITGERPPNLVVASWGLTFLGIAAAVAARVPSDRLRSVAGRPSLVGSPR